MKLSTLLNTSDYTLVKGTLDKEIKELVYHSDKACEDSLFFAIEGENEDGKGYIDRAIEKGAAAVVFDGELPAVLCRDVTMIKVHDARRAMAEAAAEFYGNPSEKLLTIGVTGTKGKTTTTFMIFEILQRAGIKTGLIGTVFNGTAGNLKSSQMTTPESLEIQRLFREMVDDGCKAVVMEVSSQGVKKKRVEKIAFDIGVFTNISPDHIGKGEHEDYTDYRRCKNEFFKMCKRAVINIDQREWPQMVAGADLEKIVFYGKKQEADFSIGKIRLKNEERILGAEYLLHSKSPCGDGKNHQITIDLPGEYNVYNGSAAIAVTKSLGVPWSVIKETLQEIQVPGRTEIVPYSDDFTVIVDYAHNGASAENLLKSIKEYNPSRIVAVFGCGGQRDVGRRKDMARAVSKYADLIIITSDNPRNESQEKIAADIMAYITDKSKAYIINNRRQAIAHTLQVGRKGDIIIVMGKGHETYQIVGDKRHHFDDREEILKAKERNIL